MAHDVIARAARAHLTSRRASARHQASEQQQPPNSLISNLERSVKRVGYKVVGKRGLNLIVQELCESRGGRPGLSVLTSLLVSVDVKIYCTVLRHWSQLVPICLMTSEDIKHQFIIIRSESAVSVDVKHHVYVRWESKSNRESNTIPNTKQVACQVRA